MLEYLESIDTKITLFINGLHNSFLDFLLYHITHLYIAIPLYTTVVLLFVFVQKKQSWRNILFIAFAVLLAALIVNVFIKPVVARPRPCAVLELQGVLRLVNNYTTTAYSFVSSHAATSFALAFFVYLSLRKRVASILIFVWAFLYSYSRIYLGVHYFGDVVCGAFVGIACAWLAYKLQKIIFK